MTDTDPYELEAQDTPPTDTPAADATVEERLAALEAVVLGQAELANTERVIRQ